MTTHLERIATREGLSLKEIADGCNVSYPDLGKCLQRVHGQADDISKKIFHWLDLRDGIRWGAHLMNPPVSDESGGVGRDPSGKFERPETYPNHLFETSPVGFSLGCEFLPRSFKTRVLLVNNINKVRRVPEKLTDAEVLAQIEAEGKEHELRRAQERAAQERLAASKQERQKQEEEKQREHRDRKAKRAAKAKRQAEEQARTAATNGTDADLQFLAWMKTDGEQEQPNE